MSHRWRAQRQQGLSVVSGRARVTGLQGEESESWDGSHKVRVSKTGDPQVGKRMKAKDR